MSDASNSSSAPAELHIVGVAGSLRSDSYNKKLLRTAASLAPAHVEVEVATIDGIPLYDADRENEHGIPDAVTKLKESIASADGLLLVSPEYNHSIPGVFKNAIDWLSRPPKDIGRVFGGRPTALMGATPGAGGTRYSQVAWMPVLRTLGTRFYMEKAMHLARAGKVFDDSGEIQDPKWRERVADFMAGFAAFAAA